MRNSKVHWFQTNNGDIHAVVVHRSRIISPLKLRGVLDAKSVFQQSLYLSVRDMDVESGEGISIKVILDSAVSTPKSENEILDLLPPKISKKILSVNVVGRHDISEAFNETSGVENHDFLSRRLREMMRNLNELAPLDSTGRKLLMLKARRHLMERDLFPVFENDPALSAQLLNWSRSALYCNASPAKNLQDAVRRVLGIDQSLILSIGLSIQKSFKIEKGLKTYLDSYIRRSVYVASVAEYVSSETSVKHDRETIYLSGMLHNFGELVLMQISPALYRHIVTYLKVNPGHNSEYVQRHILRMTYADIGVVLGEQWELPSGILGVMSNGQLGSITDVNSGDDKIIAFSQEWLARNDLIGVRAECDYQGLDSQLALSDARIAKLGSRFYSGLDYSNALISSLSS